MTFSHVCDCPTCPPCILHWTPKYYTDTGRGELWVREIPNCPPLVVHLGNMALITFSSVRVRWWAWCSDGAACRGRQHPAGGNSTTCRLEVGHHHSWPPRVCSLPERTFTSPIWDGKDEPHYTLITTLGGWPSALNIFGWSLCFGKYLTLQHSFKPLLLYYRCREGKKTT